METCYGKKVIASYEKFIDNEQFTVIIVDDDYNTVNGYYNIHILNESIKDEEFNTLFLQQPKSEIKSPIDFFDKKYMIGVLMEHFIWDRFYDEGVLLMSKLNGLKKLNVGIIKILNMICQVLKES